jgi:hypothetical protein
MSAIHCRPGVNDSRMLQPSHSVHARWCYGGETWVKSDKERGGTWCRGLSWRFRVALCHSCVRLACQRSPSLYTQVSVRYVSSRLCTLGSSGSSLAGNEGARSRHGQRRGGTCPSRRMLDSSVGTLSRLSMALSVLLSLSVVGVQTRSSNKRRTFDVEMRCSGEEVTKSVRSSSATVTNVVSSSTYRFNAAAQTIQC